MSPEQQQLQAGIQALEAQRGLLGDAVVDMAVAPLKAKLAALAAAPAPPPNPPRRSSRSASCSSTSSARPRSSQHLDPEDISAVMDGALGARHGHRRGAPRQGAAVRRRQHPGRLRCRRSRARTTPNAPCAAAWRCSNSAARSARKCRRAHGHAGFDVRVGVHTGGVLLGGGVDADGSIRGIAVNIAARMEQTAPAGALRISHDTYAPGARRVRGRGAGAADGQGRRRRPSQSYLVQRAKPRAFRIGHARHRRRGDAHDRPRRRTRSTAGRLQAPVRRAQAGRRHRGRRRRHRQEPAAVRVRGLERGAARALLPLPRPRHAADRRASPSACCATSSPGACRSPTTTASRPRRRRSKTASCRSSCTTTAPIWPKPTPTCWAT